MSMDKCAQCGKHRALDEAGVCADCHIDVFKCGGCDWQGLEVETVYARELSQRLDYNGPYTDRECPKCGMLAYLVESPSPIQQIASIMSGTEWSADTLNEVRDVLVAAGYEIKDHDDGGS